MAKRILSGLTTTVLLAALLISVPMTASAKETPLQRAAKGELRAPTIGSGANAKKDPFFSAGLVEAAAQALGLQPRQAAPLVSSASNNSSIRITSLGCGNRNTADNVRVNQDCTFRRQAEEMIRANPISPDNLIAGQNDSRVGFNRCGFDYTFNGGKTWGDGQPPFFQHLNNPTPPNTIAGGAGTFHTYDAASDPALAFDSSGRAFYSCILFDVADFASAVPVTASPAGAGGSFYNNVPEFGNKYIATEDNSVAAQADKEFIVADSYSTSPFRDNVYVTWTNFNVSCGVNGDQFCDNPIYFSRSTDHAATWSTPMAISGIAPGLCFQGNVFDPTQPFSACNLDQGSDPTVLPNGDIVVVFNNTNTAANNPNAQQLAVTSKDGGLTWSTPVKVGNDVVTGEPQCDFGRGPEECVPGPFIRTNDFPRIAVNRANGDVFATWQDYRTGEYDIHLSRSTDGGKTWEEASAPINPDTGKDHYFAAADVVANGETDRVGDSYFRSERVPGENTPNTVFAPGVQPGVQAEPSDYSLAGGSGLDTPYAAKRISPTFAPPDGGQAGFNGDYSGLVLVGRTAHPVWSDTRNSAPADQGVAHDEDIFTDAVPLPGGND
ncbi:MAG TPA: sialidase family protein [Candidatus Dormibacteraeota bacterium]